MFGYFVLGTLMNIASRSVRERAFMAPISAALALLTLLILLGG